MMKEVMGRSNSGNAMVTATESAKIADIQAKMILARNFPRDPELCLAAIKFECKNKELAERATYEFPRGDSVVKGASIRLVECVARHWGNIISGVEEISETPDGKHATVKSFCWDLQTNFADEKVFDVEYARSKKVNGVLTKVPITDPRDKYEMLANMGARRKRACMQAIIPQFIIDEAVAACEATLEEAIRQQSASKSIEEVRASMLIAFKDLADWITEDDLASVCSKEFDKLGTKDIVKLRNLWNAIKDGFVKPEAAFGKEKITPDTSDKDKSDLDAANKLFGGNEGEDE